MGKTPLTDKYKDKYVICVSCFACKHSLCPIIFLFARLQKKKIIWRTKYDNITQEYMQQFGIEFCSSKIFNHSNLNNSFKFSGEISTTRKSLKTLRSAEIANDCQSIVCSIDEINKNIKIIVEYVSVWHCFFQWIIATLHSKRTLKLLSSMKINKRTINSLYGIIVWNNKCLTQCFTKSKQTLGS